MRGRKTTTEVFKIKVLVALVLFSALVTMARASDHFDSPATVANPQADIGDVYAWISPEGAATEPCHDDPGAIPSPIRFNTRFTSTAARFFGHTSAIDDYCVPFFCSERGQLQRSATPDSASGDPTDPSGLEGRNHRFRRIRRSAG